MEAQFPHLVNGGQGLLLFLTLLQFGSNAERAMSLLGE